jgi:AhpD family alkylhydroperoxidase
LLLICLVGQEILMKIQVVILAAAFSSARLVAANEPSTLPRPIPLTRPEMKQLLEEVKDRHPRIPLPELSDEERERLGGRADNYEARLRYHYLNGDANQRGGFGGGGGRGGDPNMSLSYRFKTQLFWIVSRTNNCQYCLGHQESKLLAAGMKEDEIAALDAAWTMFTSAEQAGFRFARKFTFEPHLLSDADIAELRKHYTELQVLEMILSLAGNNAINRWKEGAGIPQGPDGGGFERRGKGNGAGLAAEKHTYLTTTSQQFVDKVTLVAPVTKDRSTGAPTGATVSQRPPLESRDDVERALAACRKRVPRLPLVDEAQARQILEGEWRHDSAPQWIRLLANFPREARNRIASLRSAEESSDLSPLLKAQVRWIVARHDRAWYAAGRAQEQMYKLGQSADNVYRLDGNWDEFESAERALFTVARKLASAPIVLTDKDVADAVELAGPRAVTQLISYTTQLAAFNRITEGAGLQLER